MTESAARRGYELLVARVESAAGRILLASEPLFPLDAVDGQRAEVTVRVANTPDRKTVFAVVAWQDAKPGVISLHSAALPPGRHQVRAELLAGNAVRLTAPAELAPDLRSLGEVMATIPDRAESKQAVHLVCAVEIAGTPARVAARLDRIEKVITELRLRYPHPDQLMVSLIGYGGHHEGRGRANRRRPADQVIVANWLAPPDRVLGSLGRLGVEEPGYPHFAQIEDVLAEIARRLHTRPDPAPMILLVAGQRPPHPARPDSELLSCPRRHDWQQLLADLTKDRKVALVAIRDQPSAASGTAWAQLGRTALMPLHAVDLTILNSRLDEVVPQTQQIPVPLVD